MLAMSSHTPIHVFISYSRRDATPIAAQLEGDLKKHGFKPWRDTQIRSSMPFGSELKAAIDNSFAMLALVSHEACRSYWVKCEWYYAISRGHVAIIPVVVKDFDEHMFPFELFPISRLYMTDE